MQFVPKNSFVVLLFAYFFTTLSCYINKGYFSVGGVVCLLVALLFLCLFFVSSTKRETVSSFKNSDFLKLILFFLIVLANLEFDEDMNGFLSFSMLVLRGGLSLAMLLSFLFLFNQKKSRLFFVSLFFLAVIVRIAVIRISVDPQVDIFDMLKYAPLSLLKGENPYEHPESVAIAEEDWQRPYPHFTYGPATLFFFLPFNLLFKDPRYFLVLTEIIGALILYQLLSDKKLEDFKNLVPLLFLYYPLFTRMTKMAYLEPLVVWLFFSGFWFLSSKKPSIAYFFFASALSVKWIYLLFLPFLFLFNSSAARRISQAQLGREPPPPLSGGSAATNEESSTSRRGGFNWKKFLRGLVVFIGTILLFHWPFVRGNFAAWYESTIMYSLREHTRWLNLASLTVQTFFSRQFHFVPRLFFWAIPIASNLLLVLLKFKQSLPSLVTATASIVLTFFLFSPQGLLHYYYFVSSLILLAITFVLREGKITK